jgi:hypothetical protein
LTPRVVVLTCDPYLWLLQPFAYLFSHYWSDLQSVVVGGYSRPDFSLTPNFNFHSIDRVNYSADRWSNGLIKLLDAIPDQHIILLLDDYWLCRTVDCGGLQTLYAYMLTKPEVLRIDLTTDRLYCGGMKDIEPYGHYDIIETPHDSPYQFSTQAGMWNVRLLRSLLQPNKSAWETELQTQVPAEMRVLGTRQSPIRYINAMNQGKFQRDLVNQLSPEHLDYIGQRGWLTHA